MITSLLILACALVGAFFVYQIADSVGQWAAPTGTLAFSPAQLPVQSPVQTPTRVIAGDLEPETAPQPERAYRNLSKGITETRRDAALEVFKTQLMQEMWAKAKTPEQIEAYRMQYKGAERLLGLALDAKGGDWDG